MNVSLKKFNPSLIILLSTFLFILYIVYVAYPFLAANHPQNESTLEWSYAYAPIHYALLFYPAYALYVISIFLNILKVKKIRWLIYPIVFIMLFISTHMVFFIFSMAILWLGIITIPLGFIGLIITEIYAIVLDIKDYTGKNVDKDLTEEQKVLKVCGYIIVPSFLVIQIFEAWTFITQTPILQEREKQQAEEQKILRCENNLKVLQKAMNNVNIDLTNAQYKDIANKYEKEFLNNRLLYSNMLGNSYKDIITTTNKHYTEIGLVSKNKKCFNQDIFIVIESYLFYRDGKCSSKNENCYWQTSTCSFYIDENSKIYKYR